MRTPLPHCILLIPALLLPALAICARAADERPVLLFLQGTADTPALDQEFATALELELETHRLVVETPFRFAAASHPARIDEIRPLAAARGADVVLWLDRLNERRVSLQVVSVAPGRAVSRSVDAVEGNGTADELAIAARQIVSDIYLSPIPAPSPSPSPPPPPPSTDPPPSPLRPFLGAGLNGAVGLAGQDGPPFQLGGDLSVGLAMRSGLHLLVRLELFGVPSPSTDGSRLSTFGVRPGLGAGYLHAIRAMAVGATLLVQIPWQRVSISDGGPTVRHDFWNLRFLPSFTVALRASRHLRFALDTGPGISVRSKAFESAIDGRTLFASPVVDWHLRLALIADFN